MVSLLLCLVRVNIWSVLSSEEILTWPQVGDIIVITYFCSHIRRSQFYNIFMFAICLLSAQARRAVEGLRPNSLVLFTSSSPQQPPEPSSPAPLVLKNILDMAPITITDQTPMETVVDMFRKLGLRQTLVTHNGQVLFVIFGVLFHMVISKCGKLIWYLPLQPPPRCDNQERCTAIYQTIGQRRSEFCPFQLI